MSVLVAILAAGESKRMGSPKLLLPWHDTIVLGHLLSQWRQIGAHNILVIHAGPHSPVATELTRLDFPSVTPVQTLAPHRGMMGSVVTAAKLAAANPSLTHLIVALGDQPHLRTETLRDLLRACEMEPGKIVRVMHRGTAGHPIALPASLLLELSTTSCATLRDFLGLTLVPVLDLTCDDSGVLVDIDTPDDYARAIQAGE